MPSYDYVDGDGLAVIDKATPDGATEPVSIVDDAIKQIKAFLKDEVGGYAKHFADFQALDAQVGNLGNRAAFLAYTSTPLDVDQSDGPVMVEFNQETNDPDSVFDVATFKFTAPADGIYFLGAAIRVDATASSAPTGIQRVLTLYKNASPIAATDVDAASNTGGETMSLSRILSLNEGDTIDVRFENTTGSGTITWTVAPDSGKTIFQGFRII